MIISAQTLITGDGKTVHTDSSILVQEGKIVKVDKTAALLAAYPNEEHVDYGQATILPGLIDMHMHLALYSGRQDEHQYTPHMAAFLAYTHAHRFLINGVTTLRDAYSPDGVAKQLQYAASRGWVRVPRIFYPNLALTVTGGLDWDVDGTVQVDGIEEILKGVRQQVKNGASWIKVMCDSKDPTITFFSQEELNMIVEEAHRQGVKAFAHANYEQTIQMCINAGFDTIEHVNFLTSDLARQMAEKGICAVSTYHVYWWLANSMEEMLNDPNALFTDMDDFVSFQSYVNSYAKNLPEIYKTDLTILAGTDCVFDGMEDVTVAWELEHFVEFGMTPVQAIACATSKSAKALGMDGEIGILAPGAIADVIVVDAAADKDITSLKRIKDVYQGGEKVCREI